MSTGRANCDIGPSVPRSYLSADVEYVKVFHMESDLLQRISIEPGKCGGRPCIRGMRIRVKDVLDMLADGTTQEEILSDFPDLEPEDIRASIAYAARYLDHAVLTVA